jgi:hypothetical protein
MSDKYSAEDIIRDINEGHKDDAVSHLNHDYLKMKPDEFKRLVDEIEKKTKEDSDNWNNVYSERDKDGNVQTVHIDDGILWDTKMFDKKDYKGNVLDPFGAMKRGLGGAFDQGKD